jgi:hypothetical protein
LKTWIERGQVVTVDSALANEAEVRELESIITSARPVASYYPVDPSMPSVDVTLCDDDGACHTVSVAGELIMDRDDGYLVDRAGRLADFLDRVLASGHVRRQPVHDSLLSRSGSL